MDLSILNPYKPDPVTFTYRTELKRVAKTCAYTGVPFSKSRKPSTEHIIPASRGGISQASNYLAVTREVNKARGNMSFRDWFKLNPDIKQNIQRVINDLDGKRIDGINWSQEVVKTLNRELGKEVFHTKNKKRGGGVRIINLKA